MRVGNRYELLDKLGEGGMGTVYRALDCLNNEIVALKRLNISVDDLISDDSNSKYALINEFRLLAGLRHPHIISVYDYGLHEGQPYLVTELMETAQKFYEAIAPLDNLEKIELIVQILEALSYLHRRGIIHRDLKPSNVMVVDKQIKLLDFGLSVAAQVVEGRAGTLMYMAPETISDMKTTFQSDLYAVGLMAYEALTGTLPFDADDISAMLHDSPDFTILEYSPCAYAIERLLLKDPNDRYLVADAAVQAFSNAMDIPRQQSTMLRESYLQASSFVGRDEVLGELKADLDAVLQGAAKFCLIGGEAGVGKSRLLEEFRVSALVSGAIVLRGQAVEYAGLPFQLWRSVIREALLHTSITPVEASILKMIVPDISLLLGYEVEDSPVLAGPQQQERLILTMIDVIQRLEHPTVILMEDLQWSTESLSPFPYLTKANARNLMIVATYRDEETPNLPEQLPEFSLTRLKRLDRQQIAELSSAMLGKSGQNPQLVDLLESETEGNTLFMIEIVRALAEDAGSLGKIGLSTLPEHVFTGGMHTILKRRLARLPQRYLDILEYTAIIGRQVDEDLLHFILPDYDIQEYLYMAESSVILVADAEHWKFAHDKLRETILHDIPEAKKHRLHRNVARAIEAIYPENADYNELLLAHWHAAQHLDKELYYLEQVAERLISVEADFTRARHLLDRGLNALPEHDFRRVVLLNLYTQSNWLQGDYDKARTVAEQACTIARQANHAASLAKSYHNLGEIARLQGNFEQSIAYFQKSLEQLQITDDQSSIARSLSYIGALIGTQGNFEKAHKFFEESLELAEQINDSVAIGDALNCLGFNATAQNDFDSALSYLKRSLDVRQAIGEAYGIVITQINLAFTYIQLDDNRAHETLWKALELSSTLQAYPLILETLVGYAWLYLRAKDLIQSAELIGLIQNHPSYNSEIKLVMDLFLSELEESLTIYERQVAIERGAEADLKQTVAALLVNSEKLSSQ